MAPNFKDLPGQELKRFFETCRPFIEGMKIPSIEEGDKSCWCLLAMGLMLAPLPPSERIAVWRWWCNEGQASDSDLSHARGSWRFYAWAEALSGSAVPRDRLKAEFEQDVFGQGSQERRGRSKGDHGAKQSRHFEAEWWMIFLWLSLAKPKDVSWVQTVDRDWIAEQSARKLERIAATNLTRTRGAQANQGKNWNLDRVLEWATLPLVEFFHPERVVPLLPLLPSARHFLVSPRVVADSRLLDQSIGTLYGCIKRLNGRRDQDAILSLDLNLAWDLSRVLSLQSIEARASIADLLSNTTRITRSLKAALLLAGTAIDSAPEDAAVVAANLERCEAGVRIAARMSVGALSSTSLEAWLRDQLRGRAHHPSNVLLRRAASTLVRALPDPAIAGELAALAMQDPAVSVRHGAVSSLRERREPELSPVLSMALDQLLSQRQIPSELTQIALSAFARLRPDLGSEFCWRTFNKFPSDAETQGRSLAVWGVLQRLQQQPFQQIISEALPDIPRQWPANSVACLLLQASALPHNHLEHHLFTSLKNNGGALRPPLWYPGNYAGINR